jgi:hypothetical protein
MDPDESEVVAHILEQARRDGVTARCAWCGRFRAGERWHRLDRQPSVLEKRQLSHGICPDCITELRRQGMSI